MILPINKTRTDAAQGQRLVSEILARQGRQGWGAKVIDRLAADLRAAFPDMKGLSPSNLQVYEALR